MSMPEFPRLIPPVSYDEALNMILVSIAMEEKSLSHLIDAESEKLKYVLDMLSGHKGSGACVEEILAVNKSVNSLLDSIMQNQMLLKSKMESAISAKEEHNPCCTGPTGPPGPIGPAGSCVKREKCCAVSLPGKPNQNWVAGKGLCWLHPDCSGSASAYLSPDCRKITLKSGRCYSISFTLNLHTASHDNKRVTISIKTADSDKKAERFVVHQPIACGCGVFTVSAGGIYVSTCNHSQPPDLMLTLESPNFIEVKQSSICIIEV